MKKINKQKVTVMLPSDLLQEALKQSGQGISATLVQGLKLMSASAAYEKLRMLRGRVRTSINVDKLRED